MNNQILSIGEVLWDLLPTGAILGGAPANFAIHAQALGAQARIVSRVGDDAPGHEILRRLQDLGMDTGFIGLDSQLPTGSVSVALAADGQPQYEIHENVAWDAIALTDPIERVAGETHAACFGTLAQRLPQSRAAIQKLVAALPSDSLRVLDINLRQSFYSRQVIETSLKLANVLKLNETELPVLAGMFDLRGSAQSQLAALADQFQLRAVAFTMGSRGSCLMLEGAWSEHGGVPVMVQDTVGAGDAFTAAFVMGLLAHWPLPAIQQHASEVAAFVCSQTGPTPVLPERFRQFN